MAMTRVLYLRQHAWKMLEISRTLPDARLCARLANLSQECELLSIEMETVLMREAVMRRVKAA
jgi:hypothetical protein